MSQLEPGTYAFVLDEDGPLRARQVEIPVTVPPAIRAAYKRSTFIFQPVGYDPKEDGWAWCAIRGAWVRRDTLCPACEGKKLKKKCRDCKGIGFMIDVEGYGLVPVNRLRVDGL